MRRGKTGREIGYGKKEFKLDQNLVQGIFEGVHRLKMTNVRIPFVGWQNCEAQFT
jgi:hypothetical protein